MSFSKIIMLFILFTAVLSCKNKPAEEQAATPLRFEERSFTKQSSTCGSDSTRCATVEVTYPMATQGTPEAMKLVNDTILHYTAITLASGDGETLPATLEEGANDFIQMYEEYTKDTAAFITAWEIQTNGKVLYQSSKYVSVEMASYSYAGGAHPNSYVNLLTFDANTGKKLTLTDMVSDTAKLKQLVEAKFRQTRELKADENLNEAGYFWDEPFAFPANVAATEQGLYFVYNPYEAAAYAAGPTDFTITNEALKGILK